MKITLLSIKILMACFALTSCKDNDIKVTGSQDAKDSTLQGEQHSTDSAEPTVTVHEKLAGELMDSGEEVFGCVLEVSDNTSAQVAAKKLGEIEARLTRIYDELKTLEPPPSEVRASIRKRMNESDKVMWSLQGKVNQVINSLDQESSELIKKSIMKCSAVMESNKDEFQRHFRFDEQ